MRDYSCAAWLWIDRFALWASEVAVHGVGVSRDREPTLFWLVILALGGIVVKLVGLTGMTAFRA
jgi:hypothetical protein